MDDIYKFADDIREFMDRYYPVSFDNWSKAWLYAFDQKTVGTQVELNVLREEYKASLREEYKAYASEQHRLRNECEQNLIDRLAEEFLSGFPKSITDFVYNKASEKGGMFDTIDTYNELSDMVHFIVEEMRKHHDNQQ